MFTGVLTVSDGHRSRFPRAVPALTGAKQTIAGAIATATHGSGHGSLSHYVSAMSAALRGGHYSFQTLPAALASSRNLLKYDSSSSHERPSDLIHFNFFS